MPIKQEVANTLTGKWQIGLCEAPCKAPGSFCYGFCCCICMAAQQRNEILEMIGEPYVCCGGLFPCGPLGEPQDANCVWAEACCCNGCAISANRFLIQTRFDRENTPCDDCIIFTVCFIELAVCIINITGLCDLPEGTENLVDCLVQTVNGCMLAQQQYEIEYVKKTGFQINPAIIQMLAPGQQQMVAQGKPQTGGMAPGIAMGVGAAIGGGAGGAAGLAMAGRPPQQQGMQPQVMGQPYGGQQQYGQPPGGGQYGGQY